MEYTITRGNCIEYPLTGAQWREHVRCDLLRLQRLHEGTQNPRFSEWEKKVYSEWYAERRRDFIADFENC